MRGITSRRRQGDFALPPDAERSSPPNGLNGSAALTADPASLAAQPEVRSPAPLPSSYVISPAPSRPRPRSRRRRSAWMLLALLAFTLILLGLVSYTFYPTWPAMALSLLLPRAATVAVVVPPSTTSAPVVQPSIAAPSPTSTMPASPTAAAPSPTLPLPAPTNPAIVPPATPQPTATPMGGGAGQIAFASDRSGTTQIWVMNVDGTDLRQVTDMPEGACQPAWSPDGARLVFISPCIRNQESYPGAGMFVVNLDGSELTPLPTVPGGDYDPSWSPDGKYIAFTSLRNSGRPRIYRLNLEDGTVERLSQQYDRDQQPAWSPDGLKIAFATINKGVQQIWTMNPDGSGREVFSLSGPKINSNPVWSPDGEVILFNQMDTPGSVPRLAAGSYKEGEYNEYRYDLGPLPVREPRFSPDALWLVFESWPEGSNHDIYLMAVNGAGRAQVTDWARFDFDPSWRPVFFAQALSADSPRSAFPHNCHNFLVNLPARCACRG